MHLGVCMTTKQQIEIIKRGPPSEQVAAILRASKQRQYDLLPVIRNALHSNHAGVRWAATVTLGELQDRDSLNYIANALQDRTYYVRSAAVVALSVLRPNNIVLLIAPMLNDPHELVVVNSLYALADHADASDPKLFENIRDSLGDKRIVWSSRGETVGQAAGYALRCITQRERDSDRLTENVPPKSDTLGSVFAKLGTDEADQPVSTEVDPQLLERLNPKGQVQDDNPWVDVLDEAPDADFDDSETLPAWYVEAMNNPDRKAEVEALTGQQLQQVELTDEDDLTRGQRETIPDWLAEATGAAPPPPAATTPDPAVVIPKSSDDDSMPDWLAGGLDEEAPAGSDDMPNWLTGVDGNDVAEQDVPDWLLETIDEESEPVAVIDATPPAPVPVQATPQPPADEFDPLSEGVDPLKWLESLAQKQGANPEELIAGPGMNLPDLDSSVAYVPDPPVDSSDSQVRQAEFSAYFPKEATPEQRYSLLIYTYSPHHKLQTEQDVQKFQDELGGTVPKPKLAKKSTNIATGTKVTVIPECDEIEFEPESITKRWMGDWTRYNFEFRPTADLLDETLFIRVSIQIAGVEIAHIKCAVDVVEGTMQAQSAAGTDDNPLALAKMNSTKATPYQRIFISYSRRDSDVAKSYKLAQRAMGNEAFLDVDNLRAGENWRAALARAIDEADIFQLFWSDHSAASQYCRHEWDYAIKTRCADGDCEGFIRPVYWRKPMPSPPQELRDFNFHYVPFEEEEP